MHIAQNISLKPYNTFGIDVPAKYFAEINSIAELHHIITTNKTHSNFLLLGGGSNILLTQPVDALVLHINLKGIAIEKEDDQFIYITAQAGEIWHDFVLWCIAHNYGGVENLSLIPGQVGTAPIQNIGAYGVELKSVFYTCNAMDLKTGETKQFNHSACEFGYRSSIFKTHTKNKYVITSVTFKLTKQNHVLQLNYGAIANQLEIMGIVTPSITDVSNAVIAIRESKLPNPKIIGNSGSFFKNPDISMAQYNTLRKNFTTMPSYPISTTSVKIPAGWLIETAGFKGKRFDDYGVHNQQALVLVNYGTANGSDILKLAQLIQITVKRIFNITLEMEVNII